MDVTDLTRDPKYILDQLVVTDNQFITKKDCQVIIPYNYLNHHMAKIAEDIYITAICVILIDNRYAVLNACAMINITPDETNQIKIAGEEMLSFGFSAGSSIMNNLTIIKDSDLAYEINNYYYTYGRVPWFMNYRDIGQVLVMHKEYSGLNISPNNVPFEIVASKISRSSENKFQFYRHTDFSELPVVVPFNSVLFNATSTTAKVIGNYLDDGFTSALLSPSTRTETVETLLRA